MNTLLQATLRPALLLGLFTVAATALLALTDEHTRTPIADAERAAQLRTLNTLVPPGSRDNDLLADTLVIDPEPLLGTRAPETAYRARRNGRVETVVLPAVAADGYSGDIQMLVAIRRTGEIVGVRVVSHRETPGLGDAIDADRSNWILGFDGHGLGSPELQRWKVKKDGGDFDQLTGATISPRAVVHAVRDSLLFFQRERGRLLDSPADAVE